MSQSMRRLVQAVTRAFYTDEHVVVMEQLLDNRYLKDDPTNILSLESYVSFQAKQVRHLLNELQVHGLVCSQELSEKAPEPGSRPQKSIYWFINYRHFFKVVRYRLWLMQKQIDAMQRDDRMNDDTYKCQECDRTYSMLAMTKLMNFSTGKTECLDCGAEVRENKVIGGESVAVQLNAKMKEQIREAEGLRDGIQELIKRCKNEPLAENKPSDHLEASRLEQQRIAAEEDTDEQGNKRARIDGGSSVGHYANQAVTISVEGTESDTLAKQQLREQHDAAVKQADKGTASAMPLWTVQSNVTGEQSGSAKIDAAMRANARAKLIGSSASGGASAWGPGASSQASSSATEADTYETELKRMMEGQKQQQQQQQQQEQPPLPPGPMPPADSTGEQPSMPPPLPEGAPPPLSGVAEGEVEGEGEEEAVYVMVAGVKTLLWNVTEAEEQNMTTEEYNAYVNLQGEENGDDDAW